MLKKLPLQELEWYAKFILMTNEVMLNECRKINKLIIKGIKEILHQQKRNKRN